ncbi:MAG: hypothetical protein NHB36_00310 [Nitrospira sp.]|nr:hypothetical protein [Nitrospira sp.]
MPLRAQRFRHLRLQNLVQHRLHQFRQSVLAAQQARQQFLADAHINPSHRFLLSVDQRLDTVHLPIRRSGYPPTRFTAGYGLNPGMVPGWHLTPGRASGELTVVVGYQRNDLRGDGFIQTG